MKKLFVLLLLLAAESVSAQERDSVKLAAMKSIFELPDMLCLPPPPSQPTSVSLIGGPNWLLQNSPILSSLNIEPRTGYTVGIDLTRSFSRDDRWQFKLGFRYNVWESVHKSGPLMWPSEYSTGVYVFDSTLPHYIEQQIRDKAWQYFAGLRWLPTRLSGQHWRWYAEAEVGATDTVLSTGRDVIRLTTGLNVGVQWKPNPYRHFSLFAQPGARYIFPNNDSFKFLPLQVEMGARWEW